MNANDAPVDPVTEPTTTPTVEPNDSPTYDEETWKAIRVQFLITWCALPMKVQHYMLVRRQNELKTGNYKIVRNEYEDAWTKHVRPRQLAANAKTTERIVVRETPVPAGSVIISEEEVKALKYRILLTSIIATMLCVCVGVIATHCTFWVNQRFEMELNMHECMERLERAQNCSA